MMYGYFDMFTALLFTPMFCCRQKSQKKLYERFDPLKKAGRPDQTTNGSLLFVTYLFLRNLILLGTFPSGNT